ncbi:MAG: Rid family detoxifying hydrolase [Eubacteriales bacterium]|nr:Rid family detoxifying hydrolase [Eubacteriales bacterium]
MKKEVIFTKKATAPTAPYSQAIKAGDTIYISGLCGDDPETGDIVGDGDMRIEAKYAMENMKATIEACGGTMNDIVKINVYVTDLSKMADFNAVYPTYFKDGYLPGRIAMQVVKFAGGAQLEMDAVAVL